jgi:alkylhydroperoxidase family enzyme
MVFHVLNRGVGRRWLFDKEDDWLEIVNQPQGEAELAAVRRCVNRGCPYGDANWIAQTARSRGLESTLRPRGFLGTQAARGPSVRCATLGSVVSRLRRV